MATQKKPNSFQRGVSNLQTISKIAPIAKRAYQSITDMFDDTDPALTYAPNVSLNGSGIPGLDTGNTDFGASQGSIPSVEEGVQGMNNPNLGGMDPSLSFGDFSSGLNGLDFGTDPFSGIEFGDNLDVGGFSDQFDIGSGLDGLTFGDMPVGDIFSDVQPFLQGLSYLADPSKIGSALKLGEGNVAGDVAQLAGLGSAVGNAAAAAGLGTLPGLSYLGPIGMIAGMASLAFGGPSSEEKRQINAYNYLLGKNKDASTLEKASYLSQPFESDPGALGQYARYFDPAVQQLATQISNAGPGYTLKQFLGDNSSVQDRLYAYTQDVDPNSFSNVSGFQPRNVGLDQQRQAFLDYGLTNQDAVGTRYAGLFEDPEARGNSLMNIFGNS